MSVDLESLETDGHVKKGNAEIVVVDAHQSHQI